MISPCIKVASASRLLCSLPIFASVAMAAEPYQENLDFWPSFIIFVNFCLSQINMTKVEFMLRCVN